MATTMQSTNRLLRTLASGISYGAWQMLPGANHSRVLASSSFDWILVDCEHGALSDSDMHDAVPAIAACGVSPIVRIPVNDGWWVKRALDAGAHGIMVPLLKTVQQAEEIVLDSKFPPWGRRGFGSPFPMMRFAKDLSGLEYLKQANDALVTVIQIETKEALENVDAIAKVKGVDVLFVGPNDLGLNIGHPNQGDHMPDGLKEAIAKIHRAAVDNGKKSGIYCANVEQAKEFASQGFAMVHVVTDMALIPSACAAALSTVRSSKGETKLSGPYGG